jgi:TetR/AcrR family transcriptional regulator, transcriptional repressor of bet genes
MPKLGMGPIRREQICRGAAAVVAREGFPGTTMRAVALEAGVSTGMLNHYFPSRAAMLEETLAFLSEENQARVREAIDGVPAGEARLRAVVRASLPHDEDGSAIWRVWIAGYGDAVRSESMRDRIQGRLDPWYDLLRFALEGYTEQEGELPLPWLLDALLNGLAIQAMVSTTALSLQGIEDAIVTTMARAGRRG